jgi:hypothetical protein
MTGRSTPTSTSPARTCPATRTRTDRPLVVFDDQALSALKGKPTDADLLADGVAVVDRALQSLLLGEDPRLVLVLENASVTPTPSTTDPMEFKVKVSVTFQMVVAVGNKQK